MKNKKQTDEVRSYLLEQIDEDDPVAVEKVERYCSLMNVYYSLYKSVNSKNVLTKVINGSQQYVKANPAITELAKVNTQMINLSKDMGISAPPPGMVAQSDKGYKESDLL
ncbi:P27 family phage terminase small subunit [Ligilactobacillus equi]|nr:P27 family phage terminase small subunit [Ligilactobacillus equi]